MARHLRGCVKLEIWQMAVDRLCAADIGNDESIRTCKMHEFRKAKVILKLAVVYKSIECDVCFSATGVKKVDCLLYLLVCKVFGVDSCVEITAAEIYGVCAARYCRL
jgi:hypothetical protein